MYPLRTLQIYAGVSFFIGCLLTFAIMMAYYSFCLKKVASASTVKQNEFQTVEMYGKTNTIDETLAEEDPEAKPRMLWLNKQSSSEDPKKLKAKLKAREDALEAAKRENESMKENVSESYKIKQAVQAIRDAGYNFTKTERCEKRYNPKWGHTEACKNWVMNAFDKKENTTFDDICTDVAAKALEGGRKAGWSGKFTFLC